MKMKTRLAILLMLCAPIAAFGEKFEREFTVIFITQATESKYGRFPFDRALLAQAVQKAADGGAKGVILKFFLDQSRSPEGDRRLVDAMSRIPVLLQARIDDSEKNPNSLDERFTVTGTSFNTSVSGSSGWIPLPEFSERAHDVCFVDFGSSPIPIVEGYQGRTVKSLIACAVELALGHKAVFRAGLNFSIADRTVLVDPLNRIAVTVPAGDLLAAFDFNSLLDGSIPASALRNKVVLIGYDGPSIPQVRSAAGTMGAHRQFALMLKTVFEDMASKKPVVRKLHR